MGLVAGGLGLHDPHPEHCARSMEFPTPEWSQASGVACSGLTRGGQALLRRMRNAVHPMAHITPTRGEAQNADGDTSLSQAHYRRPKEHALVIGVSRHEKPTLLHDKQGANGLWFHCQSLEQTFRPRRCHSRLSGVWFHRSGPPIRGFPCRCFPTTSWGGLLKSAPARDETESYWEWNYRD